MGEGFEIGLSYYETEMLVSALSLTRSLLWVQDQSNDNWRVKNLDALIAKLQAQGVNELAAVFDKVPVGSENTGLRRGLRALQRAGFYRFEAVRKASDQDLLQVREFGMVALRAVREYLDQPVTATAGIPDKYAEVDEDE